MQRRTLPRHEHYQVHAFKTVFLTTAAVLQVISSVTGPGHFALEQVLQIAVLS